MDAWKRWLAMAQEALVSAQILEAQSKNRSSASRAYYAAYQAATALLLYAGQVVPPGREAWSHEATPDLLSNLPLRMLDSRSQRGMTERLKALYEMRISADYQGEAVINARVLRAAIRQAAFIVKIVNSILLGE